jgi:penicillin-binding protein 1A
MRNALVKSLNVPTVKIIEDIGVPYSVDYAKRLGIFSPLNTDFTMALGSSGVTLYEMTKVFSEFGRLGKKVRPILVQKVEDSNGKELVSNILLDKKFQKEQEEIEKVFEERRLAYLELKKSLDVTSNNSDAATTTNVTEGTPAPRPPLTEKEKEKLKKSIEPYMFFEDPDQLMKPTTAYLTTSLLKAVIEDKNGTGGRAKSLGREVAGKTGSSNGYYDAWFIGYTPQIATGVWVGFDHEKTIGKGEVGGRAALPIWLDYMKAAHENLPIVTFPVPEGIVFANIDSETGKLPTAQSKSIIRQAFLEGTEPTSSQSNEEEKADFYKQDLNE